MKFWQEKRYDMEYRSFPLTTKQRNVYCQLVECLLGSLLGYLLGACWGKAQRKVSCGVTV